MLRPLLCGLLALPAAATFAQQPPAAATPLPYRSALEGYQPWSDQPIAPWRASNDEVGRIGGWRAYAREASGEAAVPPPATDAPAQPSSPAAAPRPPAAGHRH
jgi:hypothetical protein